MSSLREPRLRDPALLELACGLRSAIERFDRLLARHAPPKPTSGCAAPDDLTLVMLGLIALRDRLDRELTGAAERAADRAAIRAPATVPAGSAPARLEGLLR